MKTSCSEDCSTSNSGKIARGKSANIQINILEKFIATLDVDYLTFFSFENKINREVSFVHELSVSKRKDKLFDIAERIIKFEIDQFIENAKLGVFYLHKKISLA